jgi:hypothetical protein
MTADLKRLAEVLPTEMGALFGESLGDPCMTFWTNGHMQILVANRTDVFNAAATIALMDAVIRAGWEIDLCSQFGGGHGVTLHRLDSPPIRAVGIERWRAVVNAALTVFGGERE